LVAWYCPSPPFICSAPLSVRPVCSVLALPNGRLANHPRPPHILLSYSLRRQAWTSDFHFKHRWGWGVVHAISFPIDARSWPWAFSAPHFLLHSDQLTPFLSDRRDFWIFDEPLVWAFDYIKEYCLFSALTVLV